MSILMTLVIALKALNRNKMRTILTMLGMIIGVGAVITMVALGRGAQTTIEDQVKAAGTNMININAGNFSSGGVRQGQGNSTTLTAEDAASLRELPGVQYVAAGVNSRSQVIAGNQNWSTSINGTDIDFPLIRSWPTKYGAFFTQQDVNSAAKVAVLGTVVSNTLFGEDVDPTGQIIRIRNQPFKVIGVMSSKGTGAMGNDQDDVIFAPYTTVQKKLQGITHIQNITVSATDANTAPVAAEIEQQLRLRHKLIGNDPKRLHGPHPGRDGQRPHRDHQDHDDAAGDDRRRLADRRRHRDHEHHARLASRSGRVRSASASPSARAARTFCSSSWSRPSCSACSAASSGSAWGMRYPARQNDSCRGRRPFRLRRLPWRLDSPPSRACSSGSIRQ